MASNPDWSRFDRLLEAMLTKPPSDAEATEPESEAGKEVGEDDCK